MLQDLGRSGHGVRTLRLGPLHLHYPGARVTGAEAARRRRVATEQAIADNERRLENARYYAAQTAPGAHQESANSHAQWNAHAAELQTTINELRGQL